MKNKEYKTLLEAAPGIEDYWSEKNEKRPDEIRALSGEPIHIKCPVHGTYETTAITLYKKQFKYRTEHNGKEGCICKLCMLNRSREAFIEAGHLKNLQDVWDYQKNPGKISDYALWSDDLVWVICPVHHISYQDTIRLVVKSGAIRCPQCIALKSARPLSSEPKMYARYSPKNVIDRDSVSLTDTFSALWVCPECGFEYEVTVSSMCDSLVDCPNRDMHKRGKDLAD